MLHMYLNGKSLGKQNLKSSEVKKILGMMLVCQSYRLSLKNWLIFNRILWNKKINNPNQHGKFWIKK